MLTTQISRVNLSTVTSVRYPSERSVDNSLQRLNCEGNILMEVAPTEMNVLPRSAGAKDGEYTAAFNSSIINLTLKHNRPLWVAVQGLIRPTPYTTLLYNV
jgi:hypothetical protein